MVRGANIRVKSRGNKRNKIIWRFMVKTTMFMYKSIWIHTQTLWLYDQEEIQEDELLKTQRTGEEH